MKHSLTKSESRNWEAPLPLRDGIEKLPNNREEALKRLKSTRRSLVKKPLMKQYYFDFMQKLFGHAEPAPKIQSDPSLHWYLPHFGVYHPQKPQKLRMVFDSAAKTEGISQNKVLLSGPDLTNNLLGILIRFSQQTVAFMPDIE